MNFQIPVKDYLAFEPVYEKDKVENLLRLFEKLDLSIPSKRFIKNQAYTNFLRELVSQKEEESNIGAKELLEIIRERYERNKALVEECNGCKPQRLPHKLKDPRRFTVQCSIKGVDIKEALLDLGSSINIIPLAMVDKLNIGQLKITRTMELTLANQSVINSCGMVEDVLLKIKDLVFPVDFVILDIEVDDENQMILGRPFLATSHACINMDDGELMLRIGEERRIIKVCKKLNAHCYKVEVREKDLDNVSLFLNQEWEEVILGPEERLHEVSPGRIQRMEREWMESAPLWKTDPS
ncbi:hypothetical protein A2U01_0011908 [Trifolium medium]|uniref:Aspartic peptidase DDI1-type domain-containing protein n=1 Tax=Trifolium medium TaxID=97028 RepID=A0A392MXI8_9FABA|nr:hypothetical protein [Trifolium medium]